MQFLKSYPSSRCFPETILATMKFLYVIGTSLQEIAYDFPEILTIHSPWLMVELTSMCARSFDYFYELKRKVTTLDQNQEVNTGPFAQEVGGM